MLESFYDFTIARYASWDAVDYSEVAKADLVQVLGFVEGGIYHSKSMVWEGDTSAAESAKQFIFTKKDRKTIAKQQSYFFGSRLYVSGCATDS
ncbi:MAG: hypothetical protein WDZ94_05345 [Patescibacteria group bacterium]